MDDMQEIELGESALQESLRKVIIGIGASLSFSLTILIGGVERYILIWLSSQILQALNSSGLVSLGVSINDLTQVVSIASDASLVITAIILATSIAFLTAKTCGYPERCSLGGHFVPDIDYGRATKSPFLLLFFVYCFVSCLAILMILMI